MQKTGVNVFHLIVILILIGFPAILTAQQTDDDPSIESDWDDYFTDLYVKGDQTFIIALGTVFPGFFIYRDDDIDVIHKFAPPVGGTGSLIYN